MDKGLALLQEINKVRANPKDFVSDIKLQLNLFDGQKLMKTRKGETVQVIEGKDAWLNAISFLERTYPLPALVWCPELCYMSSEFESVQAKDQDINPFDLLKLHYSYNGNISFNTTHAIVQQSPRDVVISMIIDDGEQTKGNRNTIFDPQFIYFGGFLTKREDTNIASMYFSDVNQFKVLLPGQEHVHKNFAIAYSDKSIPSSVSSTCSAGSFDRIPTKKTRRSSFVGQNGHVFKKILTIVEYDDGTTEQSQEQICVD